MARAREWALRCTLELSEHDHACWATLTYDEENKPPTLRRDHLQKFFKRLRKRSSVRFFAAGEYGEQTHRPHYHAIVYGLAPTSMAIQAAWPHGHAQVDEITPAAISYVAGYCSKKIGWKLDEWIEIGRYERLNKDTGEVTSGKHRNAIYQGPFIQMSRRPGIGAAARKNPHAWRDTAVLNGTPMPVPRYLHEAWLSQASDLDIIKLNSEKLSKPHVDSSKPRRIAAEKIAQAKHKLTAEKRNKL